MVLQGLDGSPLPFPHRGWERKASLIMLKRQQVCSGSFLLLREVFSEREDATLFL